MRNLILAVIGIVFFTILIAVMFIVGLIADPNPMMPGLIGGMSAGFMFCWLPLFMSLQSPVRARVDDRGVEVEFPLSRKHVAWGEIANIQSDEEKQVGWSSGFHNKSPKRVITLQGEKGKRLFRIDSSLESFDHLVNEVIRRSSAARNAATFDPEADAKHRQREKRKSSRGTAIAGAFLLLVGLAGIGMMLWDRASKQRFEREGVDTEAVVIKHYQKMLGRRIEYEYGGPDGETLTTDVLVEPSVWNSMEIGDTVQIVYQASAPATSRLKFGQQETHEPPGLLMLLAAGGVALLGAGGLVLYWLGIDLNMDGGKFRVQRLDETPPPLIAAVASPVAGERRGIDAAGADAAIPATGSEALSDDAAATPVGESTIAPVGIRTLVILNWVFGGFGILLNAGRLIFTWWTIRGGGVVGLPGSAYQVEVDWIVAAEHLVALSLSIGLFVSAFGLRKLKSWGRRTALTAATGEILLGLMGIALTIYNASMLESSRPDDAEMLRIAMIGGSCIGFVGIIYPVVVCILLMPRDTAMLFNRKLESH